MPIISAPATQFRKRTPSIYTGSQDVAYADFNSVVCLNGNDAAVEYTVKLPWNPGPTVGDRVTLTNVGKSRWIVQNYAPFVFWANSVQGSSASYFFRLHPGDSVSLVYFGSNIWMQAAGEGESLRYVAGTLAGKASETILDIPATARLIKFYGKNLSGDILSVRLGHAGGIVSAASYRNHDGAGVDHLFKWHTSSGAHDDCFTLRRINALTWQGEFSSFDLVPIAILAAASPGYIAMPAPLDRVQLLASGGGFTTGDYELSWE